MPVLNFPSNPSLSQTYSENGKTYQWDGYSWNNKTGASGYTGSIGFTGSIGPSGGYTGSAGFTGSQGVQGTVGFTGSVGAGTVYITQNTQTSSYTLALSDDGKIVSMNVATANNLTIPPSSSVNYTIGTQIIVSQYNVGQTTIVAGLGVTLRSANGALKIANRYSSAALIKIAADEWYVFGDLLI